jgi:hypothetical protein
MRQVIASIKAMWRRDPAFVLVLIAIGLAFLFI